MTSSIIAALSSIDAGRRALHDGTRQWSFGELCRLVHAEGEWLRECGIGRCALIADNGPAWVISDLALLSINRLHVPVPAFFTPAQIAHVLDDAGIDAILTDAPQAIAGTYASFERCGESARTGLTLLRRAVAHAPAIEPDVIKVTYTSGSTGTPKGVCLAASAMEQVAQSLVAATRSCGIESHLCVLPLSTLLENIAGIYAPLLLGAQIHVRSLDTLGMHYGALNPSRFIASVVTLAPHSVVLVPELLRVLLLATQSHAAMATHLKFVAVGGASLSTELLNQARDRGLPVFQGYGLSECASVVCLNTPEANRLGSVGRPLLHASVRIDESGEICVRGAMMSGYLGSAQKDTGEICTGDLGEIDADGFVYVRGRARNMFITSMGRNVTPEWVERELTCEPAIAQAMVSGEAQPYPVALISPAAASIPHSAIEQAVRRANARLPDYARVRRWAAFPEAPSPSNGLLTSNGRLRRDRIAAKHAALLDSLYAMEAEVS